ncbi:hypothetical protein QE444_001874 [Pseudomonas sp. SORGH_AS199]|uniref:Uncharacterized protein n=1 Tax=Pseudomonas flavocrustae TaxID=2991719 RepID=A0ABT6IN81_9PSED|nr:MULTISPECIES: hypothetical protein [Pseudomonas]MDH4765901.1 hypothetical protein [Pseudomonas sp. CBMAI 2609]MDK8265391.1 hypothetical protein [Pseudomonas oryzihabitans]MDR6229517.1 hypothetical protein [Pseudomonas sp. SORGH_AS_0199]
MNMLTPPRIQTPRGIRRQLAVIVTPLSSLILSIPAWQQANRSKLA